MVTEAQNENIRDLMFQSYRTIYRIAGERIEILTIVHGSGNLATLL